MLKVKLNKDSHLQDGYYPSAVSSGCLRVHISPKTAGSKGRVVSDSLGCWISRYTQILPSPCFTGITGVTGITLWYRSQRGRRAGRQQSMKAQRLVPRWSKMSEENKTEAKTPETHMVKDTFKIKQEVKHFSWRFLTEWSDLEASAVITTLRWPPSPEETLEHPYKHPSVTATNESSSFLPSPTVEWREVSCSAPHRATWGTACRWVRNTVGLHPAQSQRPALSHQPSVGMSGLSPYRLRAAGAVWRTGQLNRWSPSASDPADNRSMWALLLLLLFDVSLHPDYNHEDGERNVSYPLHEPWDQERL